MLLPNFFPTLTETSNIKNTNIISGRTKWNTLINICHNPIEQSAVQCFRQCISCIVCFINFQWNPEIRKYFAIQKIHKQNETKKMAKFTYMITVPLIPPPLLCITRETSACRNSNESTPSNFAVIDNECSDDFDT